MLAYHAFLYEICGYLRAFLRKHLVRLPGEVEDLVQESLLSINKHRHTYDPQQPVTAWLYAIAHYRLIDLPRRQAIHDALIIPLEDNAELFFSKDDSVHEVNRDVVALPNQLPDHLRLPLLHTKILRLNAAESAAITGISVAAVKIGVHRRMRILVKSARKKAMVLDPGQGGETR